MLIRLGRDLLLAAALLAAALGPAASPSRAADCNANGTDDFTETAGGSAPDCNRNGIPDPCELLPVNPGFVSRTSIPAAFALAFLARDLDGDRHLDIAAVVSGAPSILVAWSDAAGGYIVQSSFASQNAALTSIAAGDLDANGLGDLVAGSPTGATVLFHDPARSFVLRSPPLEAESAAGALALEDFDGDGDLDLALAGGFEVLIFPNDGGGTLGEAMSLPAGSGPIHLIAADLNGDGDPDVATTNFLQVNGTASVSVFVNRSGVFSLARNFGIGQPPSSLGAEDLDGDGSLDLVAANPGGSELSMLMGRGDGTFAGRTRIPLPSKPFHAALGDLDGDLDLDIAVSRITGPSGGSSGGVVSVLWNHGNRVHRHAGDFPLGSTPARIAVADLAGDGDLEIVAGAGSGIQVLEGALVPYAQDCDGNGVPDDCDLRDGDCNGNGMPDRCDLASGQSRDCDGDGLPDECEQDCNGNGVPDECDVSTRASEDCNRNGLPDECDVMPGEPGFHRFFLPGTGPTFESMTAGDMDADGRSDIIVLQPSGDIEVLWNAGNFAFEPVTTAVRERQRSLVAPGDIDGDGDFDLVLGSTAIQGLGVILQSDRRAFVEAAVLELGEAVMGVCAADFDGDGRADAAAAGVSGDLHLAAGRADGTLAPARRSPVGLGPKALAAADLDRDGAVDIACILENGAPAVLWNEGGASFAGPAALQAPLRLAGVAAGDLDGDGDLDMAASGPGSFVVLLQTGHRAFESREEVGSPNLTALISADFDGDGLDDLIAAHATRSRGVELHRSWGDGVFDPAQSFPLLSGSGFSTLAALDSDGDGGMELVAGLERPSGVKAFILKTSGRAPTSRDRNRNGRPDECDAGAFHRGDADGDGAVNLADAIFGLRALFQGGPAPGCAEAADADNDGSVNVTDAVAVLEFLFRGGPPPAAPGPAPAPCGLDTDAAGSAGHLGCAAYEGC